MPDSNNNKASCKKQSNTVKRKNQGNDWTDSAAHNGNDNSNSKKQKTVQFNGILINNSFIC